MQALELVSGSPEAAILAALRDRDWRGAELKGAGQRFLEAARALTYAAARTVDSGAKNVAKVSSMAKVFASDTAMRVTTDAVQVFGGYGYMKEYPVEKMMRDAKITQIYEGTNQIQREVIALQLIKESLQKKE